MSRPDVAKLSEVYKNLGLDYDERVLPSIGNEVLKATVANYDAAELIVRALRLGHLHILVLIRSGMIEQTQREVVSSRIREDLLKRAREFNILLEDVSITHLTVSIRKAISRDFADDFVVEQFGKDFTQAVEQKQVAQQAAERAKYEVERVRCDMLECAI